MESLLLSIQMACKTISNLVNRAGLANDLGGEQNSDYSDGRFYSMKRLDLLSTIVLKNALQFTGKCECVAPGPKIDTESPAEHQPGVLIASALDSNYVVRSGLTPTTTEPRLHVTLQTNSRLAFLTLNSAAGAAAARRSFLYVL